MDTFAFDDCGFCSVQLEKTHDLLLDGWHGDDEAMDAAHAAMDRNLEIFDSVIEAVKAGQVAFAAWSSISGNIGYVLSRSGRADATGLQQTTFIHRVPNGHIFVKRALDVEFSDGAEIVIVGNGARDIETVLAERYGVAVCEEGERIRSGAAVRESDARPSRSGKGGDNRPGDLYPQRSNAMAEFGLSPEGEDMPVPTIVLEHDEEKNYALLVRTDENGNPKDPGEHDTPYVVAFGYDPARKDWSQGHYFHDIAEAKVDFEQCCGREHRFARGKLFDGEFCTIRWCRDDVANFLRKHGFPDSDENIDSVIGDLKNGEVLVDNASEDGWETIDAVYNEEALDIGIENKRAAELYRSFVNYLPNLYVWQNKEVDTFCFAAPDPEEENYYLFEIPAEKMAELGDMVDKGGSIVFDKLIDDPSVVNRLKVSILEDELGSTRAAMDASPVAQSFDSKKALRFKIGYHQSYALNQKLSDIVSAYRDIYNNRDKDAAKDVTPDAVASAARKAATDGDNVTNADNNVHL